MHINITYPIKAQTPNPQQESNFKATFPSSSSVQSTLKSSQLSSVRHNQSSISSVLVMMQKLVINVSVNKEKSRTKAMKIVVGVDSASLAGSDKTQIEVTGDGIDSVSLVALLRKKVGFAELVSVGPLEEKEEEDKKPEEDYNPPAPVVWSYDYAGGLPHHYVYQTSPTAGGYYYNNYPYKYWNYCA